jgi:TolB protein
MVLAAGCGGSGTSKLDLVLVSSQHGVYELYGIDADGSHRQRLMHEKTSSTAPSRVFFEVEPAWSPTGQSIAFASTREGSSDLYVLRLHDKRPTRLTATAEDDSHPTWSPDGKSIAFIRGYPGRVEVMNADGTGVRAIAGGQAELKNPAWSPDGRWIAYARREPGTQVRELWLVRPDGSGRHQLTLLGAVSYWPAWSPDSKRLAFVSDYRSSTYDLYSIGVDGRRPQPLTRSAGDDFEPSWSLDGKRIAFVRDGSIFTTDLRGHEQQLTEKQNDSTPVWRPRAASAGEG